jgi:hypothetical protein
MKSVGSRKVCLSLSSWFCIPEQGMKEMEILCRGSAFLIAANDKANKWNKGFHLVTCCNPFCYFLISMRNILVNFIYLINTIYWLHLLRNCLF